ncbi:M23 family metallopeptidase [Piscibacillus halophilus]|uniref:Peptidase family M23 n=1 Tax=Piscibacillus halophilus TaxID=571933 RepID=A0A1H9D3A9_9BACI|nr:M23 family metallopeptidase [Piscibacillus halophilus]SEQ07976.1 Peptidase family M23 [Piscibacillus halophilus]
MSDTQQQLEQYDEDRHVIENQLAELRLLESEFLDLIATLNPERIAQYSDGPQGGVDTESAKSGIVKSSTLDPISGRDLSEIKGEIPQLVASYKTAVKQISNVKEDLKQTPVDWPADTDVVTSEFGYRSDPFTSTESFHSGIDLAGPLGTEIYATGDGVVEIAGHEGSYGQSILINHRDSYQTRYSHLSRILVSRGDKVKQGQLIGLMGSTGRSTGVHLHYEIIKDGERVDPYPFMTFIQRALHE